jgi:Protein of unknown function (DUF732)
MRKAALVSVLAAGVACAPVAWADNDQYDQYMISHGMVAGAGANCGSVSPCGKTVEALLAEGRQACAAFASGVSDTAETNQLEGQTSIVEAQNVVFAAHHYLCP